jgi:hypothetical protein
VPVPASVNATTVPAMALASEVATRAVVAETRTSQ